MGCGKGKKKGKGKGKGFILALSAAVLFASTSAAIAGPYAVSAKFPSASVTKCVFVFNGAAPVENAPVVVDATNSVCKYDVVSAVNGSNVISVQYKNMWGVSSAVPFSFVKELPPTPSGMTLQE